MVMTTDMDIGRLELRTAEYMNYLLLRMNGYLADGRLLKLMSSKEMLKHF